MRQWAISVGINQYQFFQPLSYAQHDAQAIQHFLMEDVKIPAEQCVLLTETSPPQWGKSTYPNREAIQSWLDFITQQCVQPGDVLWFFFSGYGICQQGQDYLVPIEGNPAAIQPSAIPLETIFRSLQRVSTATVLVLLDINRNESSFSYETVGTHTAHLASITGIPTLLSCQPEQFARETSALGHGFFTAALLESLRSHQSTTVAALDQALSTHLPALSDHYWRPIQQPVTICPTEKRQQLILPAPIASYQAGDRTFAMQTAVTNGTAFPTAVGTTSSANTLDRVGASVNGNGLSTAGATVTAALGREALAANGGVSHSNGGMIVVSEANSKAHPVSSQRGFNGSIDSIPSANAFTSAPMQPNGAGTRYPLDSAAQNHENGIAHSDQATVPQLHSDDAEDANEISDALFWRSVLRWGGLAVVGLILGVLLRNCAAFTPKPPATAQQPTTSSTGQASGQAATAQAALKKTPESTAPSGIAGLVPVSPTTAPVVKTPSPQPIVSTQLGVSGASQLNLSVGKAGSTARSQAPSAGIASTVKLSTPTHLAKARALAAVNSNQASPYWFAIQEARQIQPGQPDYAQAKQDIALWSRQMMSIARQRGRQGRFDAAIVAARLVPQDQPAHAEVKGAIERWCPSLSNQQGANPVQRRQARAICRKGIS